MFYIYLYLCCINIYIKYTMPYKYLYYTSIYIHRTMTGRKYYTYNYIFILCGSIYSINIYTILIFMLHYISTLSVFIVFQYLAHIKTYMCPHVTD